MLWMACWRRGESIGRETMMQQCNADFLHVWGLGENFYRERVKVKVRGGKKEARDAKK